MLYIDNYVIDTPIIDIVRQCKEELTNGKLKSIEQKGDSVFVTCPVHKDGKENKPSCSIYSGDNDSLYGVFNCFTCNSSGPLWRFIGDCFDKDDNFGKKWLIDRFAMEVYGINNIPQVKKIDLTQNKKTYLDESILSGYDSYCEYLNKRHLSKEICERFNVKYDPYTRSIIFPVYNVNNKLEFLTRRSIDSKKFIIDKDASKSTIYLLNEVVKGGYQTVCVCESQINALTCWQYGYPAIALFGAATPKESMDTINKYSVLRYILLYDNDDAGKHGVSKFKKYIRKDVLVDEVVMPLGKDVNDLSKEELDKLIDSI